MDDCGRSSRASRPLLSGLAEIPRRQGRRHSCGNVSHAVTARATGLGDTVPCGGHRVALRVAGIDRRSCGDAFADLFFVGTAPCSAVNRHLRCFRRRDADRLQARREYPAPRRRPRVALFVSQEQRIRVSRIAILGGGSWGTALALVFSRSRHAHEISLWVHDRNRAAEIALTRENKTYLPGFQLPKQVRVTHDLATTIAQASIVVGAMPSAHARTVYQAVSTQAAGGEAFVSASKGLEPATHLRISEIIAQTIPAVRTPRI